MIEEYSGKVELEESNEFTYLGFVISSKGDNMANIRQLKNKSFGVINQVFSKLESLNLKRYYFQCGIILMKAVLRASLLYSCEAYYDLKES